MARMKRRHGGPWAAMAVIAIVRTDGSHAFSSSSLPPRTPPRTAGPTRSKLPVDIVRPGRRRHQTTTSLEAFASPAAAVSALTATVAGGAFSGSLHAVSGPDHLAALIPRCCGLPWYHAGRVGAVWGVGHGLSATLVGMVGFLFKKGVRLGLGDRGGLLSVLHRAGSVIELVIGISLIVIGISGIKESTEWQSSDDMCDLDTCDVLECQDLATVQAAPRSLSAAAVTPTIAVNPSTPNRGPRAVMLNGLFHGLSWDGAPSLAPVVALSTWRGSLTYLLSYAAGTTAAMALATMAIGEGTRRAAGKLERPHLAGELSMFSGFLALVVGVVWCGLALS